MTREELLDAIGNISDETVERNTFTTDEEKIGREAVKGSTYIIDWMKKNRRVIAVVASAAAILLVISAGGLFSDRSMLRRELAGPASDTGSPAADTASPMYVKGEADAVEEAADAVCAEVTEGAAPDMNYIEEEEEAEAVMDLAGDEALQGDGVKQSGVAPTSDGAVSEDAGWGTYVNVYDMIPVAGEGEVIDVLRTAEVKVGSYTAQYECIQGADENMMKSSLGREVEGNEGWYRVSGHAELKFLIHVSGEKYTLWRFLYFLADAYPYRDVLTMIYNVHSADEIDAIVSSASGMNNTAEGQKLREEIGLLYITDASDLKKLYDIMCGMTCYGDNHWEMIDYGQSDDVMLYSVRMGRDLDVFIKRRDGGGAEAGSDIGFGLKYTAVSGMFYEYGGVAYNRLSEQDRKTVDSILGITVRENCEG